MGVGYSPLYIYYELLLLCTVALIILTVCPPLRGVRVNEPCMTGYKPNDNNYGRGYRL